MEERIEIIAQKIEGWMKSNRMGDLESKPCYWSIYELSSISSKPMKNAATNCDNLSIEGLEPSLKHLMDCMSYSTHVKYFAVRLRTQKGDSGVLNNFENPYYQAPYNYNKTHQIGNIPQAQGNNNMMQFMIGMVNSMNEESRARREENNALLTELKLQNQEREHKFREYKHKQEIARLKEQNEASQNSNKSLFREIIGAFEPGEIKDIIGYVLTGKNTPYEEEEEAEEEEGYPVEDNRNQQLLDSSLSMLSTKVNNPEMLVYKMAVVLAGASEEESNQLLSAVQARYNQIKQNKAHE